MAYISSACEIHPM